MTVAINYEHFVPLRSLIPAVLPADFSDAASPLSIV
jgi:hypothetical protein